MDSAKSILKTIIDNQNEIQKMLKELEENGNLMLVKYYLKTDRNGNKIDSWCHEIWKRVEMPSAYPENIIR